MNSDPAANAGPGSCTVVSRSQTPDGCETDAAATCTVGGVTGYATIVIHKMPGISGATGAMAITFSDAASGQIICVGTYDITYTRL